MERHVEFIPDTEIFKKFAFHKEMISKRLWHYAYLNIGLTLNFQWRRNSFRKWAFGLIE